MTLNHNIPQFRCFVREPFLYGMDPRKKGSCAGMCFGVSTIENRALGFHVLLDDGACIGRLPIHALAMKVDAPPTLLDDPGLLQLWDCFSYHATVTEWDWLSEMRCRVTLPDKGVHGGKYLFTVDYYGSTTAEDAGDSGWKCHHVIELDNGWLCAQPNNRVCWFEPSAVTPFGAGETPDYLIMPRTWKTEDRTKWRTDETNRMFYGVEQ